MKDCVPHALTKDTAQRSTFVLMQVFQGSQHHCLALKGVNSKSDDLNIFSVSILSISLVGFLLTLLTSFELKIF